MSHPDFNLLVTLDVLLAEGSVARAARRLRLSPSAMSRALARLREVTGDPLLVRAGRGLVPTPHAADLRDRVNRLVQEASSVLSPSASFDPATLHRLFTLRVSEGFVETFGPALNTRLQKEAPGVRLRFMPKLERDSLHLRDGSVDLETGVIGASLGPEIRTQLLFRDRFIGVARANHPLSKGRVTLQRYTKAQHIHVSRRAHAEGPVDEALAAQGVKREIVTTVGGFAAALALARNTDWIATVPERHTAGISAGMFRFKLPFETPAVTISMLWHPRMDADPAHRWLRSHVIESCGGKGHDVSS